MTVALCVLWVRSYFYSDTLHFVKVNVRGFVFNSYWGGITHLAPSSMSIADKFTALDVIEWSSMPIGSDWDTDLGRVCGFRGPIRPTHPLRFTVPHWFLVLIASTFAAAPWLSKMRSSFSLRTLLLATTLLAIVLGFSVWATR
jgi:hypothetical protein